MGMSRRAGRGAPVGRDGFDALSPLLFGSLSVQWVMGLWLKSLAHKRVFDKREFEDGFLIP
jgi:hypothetical protein